MHEQAACTSVKQESWPAQRVDRNLRMNFRPSIHDDHPKPPEHCPTFNVVCFCTNRLASRIIWV